MLVKHSFAQLQETGKDIDSCAANLWNYAVSKIPGKLVLVKT